MTTVYDTFIFLNELDVLEWRLRELWDVVDVFVVVEATRTFRGTEKPLHLWQNRDRFKPWWSKVYHIVEHNMPRSPTDDPRRMYEVEGIQRNAIARGLEHAYRDDTVMVSDVDEIPDSRIVNQFRGTMNLYKLEQELYYYYLNLKFPHPPWFGTRLGAKHWFDQLGGMGMRIADAMPVHRAGWHFSFFGGPDTMAEKVRAWSHASAFVPETQGDPVLWMEASRQAGLDWDVKRMAPMQWVDHTKVVYPRPIQEDGWDRWSHHLGPATT